MNRRILYAALGASLLLCLANLSSAADGKAAATDDSAAVSKAKEPARKVGAKPEAKSKKAAKVKLVNINGASKEELMKLPGVSAADADKIIAGRPYGSKAWLVSHKILSEDTYQLIKGLVIATQPNKDAAKNAAQYPQQSAPKNAPKK